MSQFNIIETENTKNIDIPAKLEDIENAIELILEETDKINFDKKTKYQIVLVCEEALANIVNYAYPNDEGNIHISYETLEQDKQFIIQIIDSGIPFNPLDVPEPDLNIPLEARNIGGLGVFLIKNIMDNVIYERKDNKNILTLYKNF